MNHRKIKGRLLKFVSIFSLSAGTALAEPPPVEYFGRLPALKQVRVAPGGEHLTMQVNSDGFYVSGIYKLHGDGSISNIYGIKEDKERWVRTFRWVNPNRIVMSIGFKSRRWGTDSVEARLFGLTPGEDELEALFRYESDEIAKQFEDVIVSFLYDDPEHILVSYRYAYRDRYNAVMKVPVNKRGRHSRVQRARTGIHNWRADHNGIIRLGTGFKTQREKERRMIIRLPDAREWQDISHRAARNAPDFSVRGFSAEPNIAYVESSHEHDTGALYEYDILTDNLGEKVFYDAASEIGRVLTGRDGRLRGISFGEELDKIEWLDPDIKAEVKRVKATFKDKAIGLVRESIDAKFAVYDVSGATEPSRFYIRDREAKKFFQLPSTYPELEQISLGEVVATKYTARDGLDIPAYITLPFGIQSLEGLKDAPFIVLPHGGPTARDFRRFDYWTQFFASRGYGVLQMNFRGSAGYGQSFREAGDREWGLSMQDDITDGANWLVENGYAAKDKLAIVGGSYGGYAALMGVVKTPDLYQCAVSFAGVTDLPGIIKQARQYVGGKAGSQHIGRLWKDRTSLRENSPINRAADIRVPVLLVHGEDDRVVDVKQSRKMHRALQSADKPVKYIEFPKGSHNLSIQANRIAFLRETENFLDGCLK